MPPGHDAGDVTSAFEFVFAPIISALDDPITTMTTAAEERARRKMSKQKVSEDKLRAMKSFRCLDLSNGRLAREPFLPENLTALTSLRLNHNGVKGIQDATMLSLTGLTWLELHDNNLSELPQEWSLCDLKGLLLHNNQITHLPRAISGLTSLTTLTLAGNKLECPAHPNDTEEAADQDGATSRGGSFPEGWAENLMALSVLDLSRNRLCGLPDGIPALSALGRLVLDRNSLDALPDLSAANLASLHVLSVANNRLACLPVSISVLTELRILNVSGNLLTRLESTGGLPRLAQLAASRNRLRAVHASVSTALQHLDLSQNAIGQLAYDVLASVERLELLDLTHNKLQTLPFCLGMRTALKTLRLGGNAIQSLDFIDNLSKRPTNAGLGELERLVLAHNELKALPDALGLLSSLTHLDLHGNQLATLPPALADCKLLSEVLLGNNELKTVPVEWGDGRMARLKALHISGNADLTIEKVPKAIRPALVGTLSGGGFAARALVQPGEASKTGTRAVAVQEKTIHDRTITLTTGAKVSLTMPSLDSGGPQATRAVSADVAQDTARDYVRKGDEKGDEDATATLQLARTAKSHPIRRNKMHGLPDKGGISYSNASCSWDPIAVDAVNLVLHGPFNQDLDKEKEEAMRSKARREAVLAKEEERAQARRQERRRARLTDQDRPDQDRPRDSDSKKASAALGRIDNILAKLSHRSSNQRSHSIAESMGASTAPSEAGSVFGKGDVEENAGIDFDQVPIPADMLQGDKLDSLGFGMFDIFDVAELRRKQRGATGDKRDERTAWRPSYMRASKSGSRGDASKQIVSKPEMYPRAVNPTQDVQEAKQARNDDRTRTRPGIAHVLLPPQILPKAKGKDTDRGDGWSAW